jgi:hypothetical protein
MKILMDSLPVADCHQSKSETTFWERVGCCSFEKIQKYLYENRSISNIDMTFLSLQKIAIFVT